MRTNRARDMELPDLDVVVVEASKPVQAIVRSILFAARVSRVRVFDNAEDAYRSMLVEPPNLILVDDDLGEVDGLTLIRTMRDPRSGPLVSVPAILMTSHPTRRLVERSIAVGVHYVLAKPLSPANVMRRIEAVIHDERAFVFDEVHGFHVLENHDELLAGQRQRWKDLHAGARAFPVRDEAPAPAPVRPPRPAPEPPRRIERKVAELDTSRHAGRALGLSVPLRAGPGETSTGQAANRTA
jgi:two-component system, OmpR family, phosphate regulon response regulator PhoB